MTDAPSSLGGDLAGLEGFDSWRNSRSCFALERWGALGVMNGLPTEG